MTSEDDKIRIVIADGQTMFREALENVLGNHPGILVLGAAESGARALKMAQQLDPDILLLDLDLPNISGMEVLRRLPKSSRARAVVLSDTLEKSQLLEALQRGAGGVLLKSLPTQVLFKALQEIKVGGYWIDRTAVADFVHTLREGDVRSQDGENNGFFGLTARERKIVSAVVDGLTNKDIAKRFSISEQTVKHHLTSIFGKVRVTNRLELALFAMDNGLVA